MLEISAILPTRNRSHLLPFVLDALKRQTLPASRFEIIAVDDGSTDDTFEVLKRACADLPLRVFHQRHAGLAAAKNLGVFASRSPIVLFMDDDDVAAPHLLETHVRTHTTNPWEEIAVLGYTGLAPEVALSPLMRHVTEVGCQLFSYGWMKPGMVLGYTEFWGGRSSCKRKFLMDRGIFNPIFAFGYEDIELGWRLAQFGLRVVYEPAAVSTMIRTLTFRDFCTRQQRQGRSQRIFAGLHASSEIRKYCEIDTGLALWKKNAGRFTQYVRWVERLDRLATVYAQANLPIDTRVQSTLDEAYRAAFLMCRAKGLAWDAGDDLASAQTLDDEGGANASGALGQEQGADLVPLELDRTIDGADLTTALYSAQVQHEDIKTSQECTDSVVFQEATPGHEFLFDTFSELHGAQLVKRELDPWLLWEDKVGIKGALDFLDFGLQKAREHSSAIIYLTLDYWVGESLAKDFQQRVSASRLKAYAFLHRYPTSPGFPERLQEIAPLLQKVIVFSPDMKRDLETNLGLTNVEYVPLPAMIENFPPGDRAAIRARLSIPEDSVVVSMLGEARTGKGYDIVLDALAQLDSATKQKAFFLFGGKASSELRKAVLDCLNENGLSGLGDLRVTSNKRQYVVLTDSEFSDYVQASDVGLLIYREDQRFGMSGVMPNYIVAGKPVIATADSYAGKLVSNYGLGWVLSGGSSAELAKLITEAVSLADDARLNKALAAYRPELQKTTILARMRNILGHADLASALGRRRTANGAGITQHESGIAASAIDALLPPKATIVVCTYNRYEYLARLLPKLEHQNVDFGYEVLIVDNSDDEATKALFYKSNRLSQTMRVVPSWPAGLSRARNVGVEAAQGKYIVFIDDDADPGPDWLREIVAAFEACDDAAVIGGPIWPIWPGDRPEWVPVEFEGCMGTLMLGDERKRLDYEYVYGCNMAFRADVLREIGGFREDLGRKGGVTLLSNEELQVQDEVRKKGYAIYYVPAAGLCHHVHKNRVDRGWLRRRMTWQAVSDALSSDSLTDAKQGLESVISAADRLGIDRSFLYCLLDSDRPEDIKAQLEFLRGLTTVALSTNAKISVQELRQWLRPTETGRDQSVPVAAGIGEAGQIQDLPVNLAAGGVLFFEATPGHEFLFDTFSGIKNASLLARQLDPWAEDKKGIDDLFAFLDDGLRSASKSSSPLVFLTLDYWERPFRPMGEIVALEFKQKILDSGIAAFAFLHRYPTDPAGIARLQFIAPALQKLLVFSPDMKGDLERNFGLPNVEYVPLPGIIENFPVGDRAAIRARLSIPADRVVVSLLGEARKGKGYDLVLDALARLDRATRKKAFFLFGGKASPELQKAVIDCLGDKGLLGHADLRVVSESRRYAVLSDAEFSDYVWASDIGLLIYREDQRYGMSGLLPNYVLAGKPVIVTADSYAGRFISNHGLGWSLSEESPAALAKLIVEAVRTAGDARWDKALAAYRSEVEKKAVLARMKEILGC